jgi:hypothetical protein
LSFRQGQRTEEGKLHLFVAIDRTSKFAFAQLHEAANVHTATAFLTALIAAVPYKIHTVLTDNGVQFCDMPSRRSGQLHAIGCTNSIAFAVSTASNTALPSPTTRGRTARSNE